MKEIVFNDKAIEFFKGEQKKALDDIAVTVVHKDTLKNKDKVINDLLKRISDLEFEVERLEKVIKTKDEGFKASTEDLCEESTKIQKAIEYIEEMNVWCIEFENFGVESKELLDILKGVDKE